MVDARVARSFGVLLMTTLRRRWLRSGRRSQAALEQALQEFAEAHAELGRRQSFTDALLETIEVGIVSCDVQGRFVVSNRAERQMFGLETGLDGLLPEHLPALIDVLTPDGRSVRAEDYPLMRTLRGEAVRSFDVLVGPVGFPHREVVVNGSQILGPDGELLGAVAALSDVTAERTVARALAEERRKLSEAQRLGQLGSFRVRPDGVELDLLRRAVRLGVSRRTPSARRPSSASSTSRTVSTSSPRGVRVSVGETAVAIEATASTGRATARSGCCARAQSSSSATMARSRTRAGRRWISPSSRQPSGKPSGPTPSSMPSSPRARTTRWSPTLPAAR